MRSADRRPRRGVRAALLLAAAAALLMMPGYPVSAEPPAGAAAGAPSGAVGGGTGGVSPPDGPAAADDGTVRPEAVRSGGGVYRSPSGSFSGGGFRSGVSPGGGVYRTGPRSPSTGVTRPPGTTTPGGGAYAPGRAGSFFGGLAAGTLLGHLFNPFAGFGWGWGSGYGYGFGWSIVSLLIWAALLYAAYRIIRRLFGGGRGRGPGGGWQR